jgi:hypothetical protein
MSMPDQRVEDQEGEQNFPVVDRRAHVLQSSIGQLADIAKGAITGETAAPGALRTITSDEVRSALRPRL